VVHPVAGRAVRDGRDGVGAARDRRLQAGDGDADGDGGAEHRSRARADVRLGNGPSAGRGRDGDLVVRRGRRRRGRADRVRRAQARLPGIRRARMAAAPGDVGPHAGDRSAGGRRVRADGRLHGRRLFDHAALWCGGAGRFRHRIARDPGGLHARGRAGLRRSARSPVRTSARAWPTACARRSGWAR
jgi:hypothetical protein